MVSQEMNSPTARRAIRDAIACIRSLRAAVVVIGSMIAVLAIGGQAHGAPPLDSGQQETIEYLESVWAHMSLDEKAAAYRKVGRLVASIDRPENAIACFDQAIAIHEDQTRGQPDAEDHRLAMADTLHAKARALSYFERPQLAEARNTCQQAIALAHKTLEKADPGKSEARSLLANAEMTLAEIEIARGDFAAAKAALENIGRRKPVVAFMRQCLQQARTRTQRLSPRRAAAGEFLEWIKQSLRTIGASEHSTR